MDGTNAAGRKVSLLNDNEPPLLVRLPSITPSLRSRTSSYSSLSAPSPPTPRLVRSDSSDSTTMQTPSPITPDFNFEALSHSMGSPVYSQNAFFTQQKDPNSPYPPIHQPSGALAYHPAHPQQHQQAYFPQQSVSEQRVSPAPAPAHMRPKKNNYPCPMAKQFNCNDFFTTSGHAARHAKKHTGKKDAHCPECNKAFTRKDNMEQHRRTHQNGRSSSRTKEREVKKAKHQVRRPKPVPLQSPIPSLSDLPLVDPLLPISPAGSYMASAARPSDFADYRPPYPDPTGCAINLAYNAGSSYGGLDALAIAASGEERNQQSS